MATTSPRKEGTDMNRDITALIEHLKTTLDTHDNPHYEDNLDNRLTIAKANYHLAKIYEKLKEPITSSGYLAVTAYIIKMSAQELRDERSATTLNQHDHFVNLHSQYSELEKKTELLYKKLETYNQELETKNQE